MTLPASTRPAVDRPVETVVQVPVQRHPGCYWDHEQAGWVRYAAVPAPRPAQD
jgi:hypothetical protein